jgi:5-(carboxyamino)imidazole ribonucleotide synthase
MIAMAEPASQSAQAARAFGPGSVLGILGGGQLARMIALAAADYGIRCHIYAPEEDSPAFDVAAARTIAGYRDEAALTAFADAVDVVTLEFENVPVESVAFLERLLPVRPGSKALAVAQDRLAEKSLARSLGVMTAEFAAVNSRTELDAALSLIGCPAVLKTNRMGYDGKGQAKIMTPEDADAAFAAMDGQPAILEAFVPFQREVSVIAARRPDGAFAAFDVTENEHRDHILHRSIAPAHLPPALAARAVSATQAIADALDYAGVMAVEFFVLADDVLVNEIAPRVHNSGHWTSEGAETSQFHQHVRAVCGLPLGSTRALGQAMMLNLIGDEADGWASILAEPGSHLHLYGKLEARPGRKMGHVTRVVTPGGSEG